MPETQNHPKRAHYTETPNPSPRLSEAVEWFTAHARLHGRSRKTIQLYEWVFETVRRELGDPRLEELKTAHLRRYLTSLLDRGYRATSLGMHYRVLHAFFRWCLRERLIPSNPLDDIPKPKVPKLFPFTLDDSQIQALLKACDKSTKHGYRNYVILLLFLDCGLRLHELIDLRLSDVSLAQRALRIRGKGAKERVVYLGAKTTKALRRWLEMRGSQTTYSDHVFIDRKGEPLKPRWVQEVIARLGKRAGLKQRLSPHRLRHVSATLAVRNGMDPFTLQRLYGWESVETAMRYVNAANPQLREVHARASPVDRLFDL